MSKKKGLVDDDGGANGYLGEPLMSAQQLGK